ncbi:helix-turn-helix domain-containing protein [Streptomyces sp. NPDC015131]|uniref:helix-turn-helix domain-containing protein n=1 Tax=Streptomyces sp. NPDC015131 TaxID=3364941 RepID=UPI0036F99DEA
MDRDWTRLGTALRDARRAHPVQLTQEQMADDLGVSRSVIQLIEGGQEYKKPTPTIKAYARRVGWTDDSVERVLAGGHPSLAYPDTARDPEPAEPAADSKLPLRIQHELRQDGELVDTAVIPLGDGGTMVVVVKNPAGATPEQRKANLSAWLEAQGELQSLSVRADQMRAAERHAD